MPSRSESTGKQLGGATGKGFQPGQSGNPGGRPKGSVSIVTRLRHMLKDEAEADKVARAILDEAQAGNPAIIKILLDRLEGAVRQEVGIAAIDEPLNEFSTEELAAIEAIRARHEDSKSSGG